MKFQYSISYLKNVETRTETQFDFSTDFLMYKSHSRNVSRSRNGYWVRAP